MTIDNDLRSLKNLVLDYYNSNKRIALLKKKYVYKSLNKVRISVKGSAFDDFIKLQTPDQLGVWGNTAFVSILNPDINVVINRANPYVPLNKDKSRNWLLHIEPPGYIRKLDLANEEKIKNFGRVYTSDPELYERGGKFIPSPPYVHWHLAISSYSKNRDNMIYDYDFLVSHSLPPAKETNLVSINSAINDLPGHKKRADFVSLMCNNNIEFEIYGASLWSKYKQYKGSLSAKWPVYSKSKYVLAIENEISPYYWTEKFTDAILCFSIPIYYGSNKINDYFPEGSYIPLDITKKSAIDDLKEILKSDFYEKNLPKLIEARNLILLKHNMFNFLDHEINNYLKRQ